ncbi:DUF6207 family protein [Streptomyces sp. NPDC050564]|uniref:DUF6207 family protein n=1 Tax=Streptomyces sp. NPDC050564 TaxID=3365631 RepID=UPI0037B90F4B
MTQASQPSAYRQMWNRSKKCMWPNPSCSSSVWRAWDDETMFAFQNWGAQMCPTADRAMGDPGQPGVRIRLYADLRQALPLGPPRP